MSLTFYWLGPRDSTLPEATGPFVAICPCQSPHMPSLGNRQSRCGVLHFVISSQSTWLSNRLHSASGFWVLCKPYWALSLCLIIPLCKMGPWDTPKGSAKHLPVGEGAYRRQPPPSRCQAADLWHTSKTSACLSRVEIANVLPPPLMIYVFLCPLMFFLQVCLCKGVGSPGNGVTTVSCHVDAGN